MSRYSIEDAEAISRAFAGGFEIPPAHVRAELYPGDLATLFFNIEGHLPGEPLRVQVLDVEAPGQYIGRMAEECGDLKIGTPVAFDERHVAWIEPPGRVSLSGVFDIWKKKGEEPPPSPPVPPPSRAEFLPPEGGGFYQPPQDPPDFERIPLEESPRPPVVYLPYRPTGMVPAEQERLLSEFKAEDQSLVRFRGEFAPPSPVKQNPFAIWSPGAKENLPAPLSEKAGAFAIWTPPPSQAPIVAPPEKDAGIFSIWNPEAMALEAEAMKQMDLWEVMVPKSEQGSLYQPEEKDPFEVWQPEESAPMSITPAKGGEEERTQEEEEEEEEEWKAESEAIFDAIHWKPPTVEWMAKRLKGIFDLNGLWDDVRSELEGQGPDYFDDDDPTPILIKSLTDSDGNKNGSGAVDLFDFLGLDRTAIDLLSDRSENPEDVWEELTEVEAKVDDVLSLAFDKLKPGDLPGRFGVYQHADWGSMVYIGYLETFDASVSPEERRSLNIERERIRTEARKKYEKKLRSMVGNWKPMAWEQAAELLDVNFGIQDLVQNIRKEKKTKRWKREMRSYGSALFIVEDFGDDNGNLEPRVAEFLGVPMSMVERFADEDLITGIWEAVFYPGFESFEIAWENIRPDDLPGKLVAIADARNAFCLCYKEGEDYNEGEGSEEGEQEED